MLRKLVAAAAIGLALVAGSAVPAQAAGTPPGTIRQHPDSGYLHYYSNWGGVFHWTDLRRSRWIMPNGYYQVFVVGTDHQLWTNWSGEFGRYGWTDMLHGWCNGAVPPSFTANGWEVTLKCRGRDGQDWINKRSAGGTWSGWRPQ